MIYVLFKKTNNIIIRQQFVYYHFAMQQWDVQMNENSFYYMMSKHKVNNMMLN